MPRFRFDFDWEQPQGAPGAELRATWARLQVNVDDVPVTRAFHPESKTVRDYIYLPLYPLAEWVAHRWWRLRFDSRPHNLRLAREGFCVPDLEFLALGDNTQLIWHQITAEDWPVRFLESGGAVLPSDLVTRELTRFVEAVLRRLDLEEVHETLLQQEWGQIQQTGPEEDEFCRAAAALGLDPFEVTRHQERAILAAHEELGSTPILESEFFHAARHTALSDQLDHLKSALSQAEQSLHGGLKEVTLGSINQHKAPWEQGYELARELRERLGVETRVFRKTAELIETFSMNGGPAVIDVDAADLFDALVTQEPSGKAAFALASSKSRESARSFSLCRALGELMIPGERAEQTRIITTSQTERQKRNRAFAAEFLAPSELLRSRLPSTSVSLDVVEDLAEEFGVSPVLMQHQLENHHLAEVNA